jgi:Tfp pilus assembly protein PilV
MGRLYKKGVSLVEVLIAVALLNLIVGVLVIASNLYIKTSTTAIVSAKSAFLAEEGIEAVKSIRDRGWTNISSLNSGTTYYLYLNSTPLWVATTTPQIVDGIVRNFVIENVNRNGADLISDIGTNDPNTKKLTVSVSWQGFSGTSTKSLSTYITDLSQ